MGMIVDSVSEVMSIHPDNVQPPPDFGKSIPSALKGLGKVDEKLVILLDIDNILLGEAGLVLAA